MPEYVTEKNTLNEILSNPHLKKLDLLFDPSYYTAVPGNLRKTWLKNIRTRAKTERGTPFPVDGLLECANLIIERRFNGEIVTIPIYKDERKSCLIPFLCEEKISSEDEDPANKRPAVIVVPGGAYHHCAVYREGIPIAEKLKEMGFNAFVLSYECKKPFSYPAPLTDMASAIQFIRKNSEKLNVDPQKILVMGFSAGGHLAGAEAALYKEIITDEERFEGISKKPDGLILCYPVTSFLRYTQKDTVKWLLGDDAEGSLLNKMSLENSVDQDFPRTYIWCCSDDATVDPMHTTLLNDAMEKAGIMHKMHIFGSGGHAIALGEGTEAQGWLKEALQFFDMG